VVDVFAMPQSGTGVSVEAVDPVFQTDMLERLKQTNRPQMVVGWYHSHPGFGCWLSGVDINTQQVIIASCSTHHRAGCFNWFRFSISIRRALGCLNWFRLLIFNSQSFEALNKRAVAVVVDPIQSVKGKVVIDCFRSINPQLMMMGQAPRQTTSNLGKSLLSVHLSYVIGH
jgi:26S proteasome regulatory subunit N11